MMKLKFVGVIASLALVGSLVACSGAGDNQAAPNNAPSAAPASSTGDAMKNEGGAMKKEGDAMKKDGDAMKKDGDAMKKDGDAMKKDGDAMKKEDGAKPAPTSTP
ncbi:hypothetical protein [Nostoc piscinale]|uniref:hypothetical protein n=1 Tax=Nostoc piscinale TaxID=224012 RepID=UPI0039A5805B